MTSNGDYTFYPISDSNGFRIFNGPNSKIWQMNSGGKIHSMDYDGVIDVNGLYLNDDEFRTGSAGVTALGYLWFIDNTRLYKVDVAGTVLQTFTIGTNMYDICYGPDGNFWIADFSYAIRKVTPSGDVTTYTGPAPFMHITSGKDGNIWATAYGDPNIYRISTSGVIDGIFTSNIVPRFDRIITGPDRQLWCLGHGNGKYYIVRMTYTGHSTAYVIQNGEVPIGITMGPDENMWICGQTSTISKMS